MNTIVNYLVIKCNQASYIYTKSKQTKFSNRPHLQVSDDKLSRPRYSLGNQDGL